MKKRCKIFSITTIGIFVAIPVIASIAAPNVSADQPSVAVTQQLAMQNFHRVIVSGNWDVKIIAGDHYQVKISASKMTSSNYAAMQNGDAIEISNVGLANQERWLATIILPQLSNLELRGTSKAEISGFPVENLSVIMDGTHSVMGANNQIKNLKLHASGTSSVDLSASEVVNAEVEIFGTNHTKLNMRGGDLMGEAQGTVAIACSGKLKSQTVKTAGTVKIECKP